MPESPPVLTTVEPPQPKPDGYSPSQLTAPSNLPELLAPAEEVVDIDAEEQAAASQSDAAATAFAAPLDAQNPSTPLTSNPPSCSSCASSSSSSSSGRPSSANAPLPPSGDEDDVVEEGICLPAHRLRSRATTPAPIVDIAEDLDNVLHPPPPPPPHQSALSDPSADDVILTAEVPPSFNTSSSAPNTVCPSVALSHLNDYDDELQIVGEAPGALNRLFPFQRTTLFPQRRVGTLNPLHPGPGLEREQHPFFEEFPVDEVPLIAPPLSVRLATLRNSRPPPTDSTSPAGVGVLDGSSENGSPSLDLASASSPSSSSSGLPRRPPPSSLWALYSAPLAHLRASIGGSFQTRGSSRTHSTAAVAQNAVGQQGIPREEEEEEALIFSHTLFQPVSAPRLHLFGGPDLPSTPWMNDDDDGGTPSSSWSQQQHASKKHSKPVVLHPSDPQVLVEALMAKLTCPICYRGFRRKKAMTAYSKQLQKKRLDLTRSQTPPSSLPSATASSPDSPKSQSHVLHRDAHCADGGTTPSVQLVPCSSPHEDPPRSQLDDGRGHTGTPPLPPSEASDTTAAAVALAPDCLVSSWKKRKLDDDPEPAKPAASSLPQNQNLLPSTLASVAPNKSGGGTTCMHRRRSLERDEEGPLIPSASRSSGVKAAESSQRVPRSSSSSSARKAHPMDAHRRDGPGEPPSIIPPAVWIPDARDIVSTEVETSELRVGKCGHVYCEACIKRYLKVKKKCPVCNQPLLTRQLYPLFL